MDVLLRFYEAAFSLGYHSCLKMDTNPFPILSRDFAEMQLREAKASLLQLYQGGLAMMPMSDKQLASYQAWAKEQDKKAAEKQGLETPNYGVSGGQHTFMYTPTTLGMVIKVRHNLTQEEIDLTEYNNW